MVEKIRSDAPVLVIGLGRFGAACAGELDRLDREVLAIVGEAALAAIGQTAGHGNQFAQMFLVRSDDVEADVNPRLLRVVHGGREYRVEELEGWPQAGMTLLRCVVV